VSRPPAPAASVEQVSDPPLPPVLGIGAVVVFCLVGALSAVIEVLLIPLYLGSDVFPVTILITIALNIALPRLVRMTVDWGWAIALPLVSWILVAIVLGFTNTNKSILVPGSGQASYVALGFYFLGTLAGFVSVLRQWAPPRVAAARR
jgi:hypothetical protein